jgi:gamma-butyrobetaine dioxygenase
MPGDIMMMDNHQLLHGRTAYDANEGKKILQGCYITMIVVKESLDI